MTVMATLTLKYNAHNSLATRTIEYILSLGVFTAEKKEKMSEVDMALQEVKKGKINRYKNVDDLLQKINS